MIKKSDDQEDVAMAHKDQESDNFSELTGSKRASISSPLELFLVVFV